MTSFPGYPRLLKGGIVLIDPVSSLVRQVIALQYNPDTITRSFQPQAFGAESGDRSEALRLKGPPVETYKVEIEIDATDQLENPEQNPVAVQLGLQPQLALLETILYPQSARLIENNNLAKSGTLEIVPAQAPLTLFVWSAKRIVPVRLTDLSVTEEAFDPALNPIRAKVSLGMRVLTVNDLGFDHKGGSLYMIYHQQKELLARSGPAGSFSTLGIGGIP
jgi:hypothetical protein